MAIRFETATSVEVRHTPKATVSFNGAEYSKSPRLKRDVGNFLGATREGPSGTTVRFTAPAGGGDNHVTEFTGRLGNTFAANLLRGQGEQTGPGERRTLERVLDRSAETAITGVKMRAGRLVIPGRTNVAIERSIGVGIPPPERSFPYEPLADILPVDSKTETLIKGVRTEYEAYLNGDEQVTSHGLTPRFAYEAREIGGKAEDETLFDTVVNQLAEGRSETELKELMRIAGTINREKKNSNMQYVRSMTLSELMDIRGFGPRAAAFVKVMTAIVPANTSAPEA
jgi:hypothetical protein